MHLVCPHCATTNRVPEERLDQQPRCGQCATALMDPKPAVLTQATFERFVQRTELPVVVDFWAPWCGPCRMMAPQFEAAAAQAPRLRFAKVDTEAEPALGQSQGIRSIPTLALYQGGREVARRAGAVSAGELLAWVRTHAAPANAR